MQNISEYRFLVKENEFFDLVIFWEKNFRLKNANIYNMWKEKFFTKRFLSSNINKFFDKFGFKINFSIKYNENSGLKIYNNDKYILIHSTNTNYTVEYIDKVFEYISEKNRIIILKKTA